MSLSILRTPPLAFVQSAQFLQDHMRLHFIPYCQRKGDGEDSLEIEVFADLVKLYGIIKMSVERQTSGKEF